MARRIGSRYTAHQVLGRGSAGTVWLGDGPDGPVAIKLLREDLSEDRDLVGRFVQERQALLSLDHPRVVGVRDLVVDGDDLALVMELVRGTDLRTRLEHERRLLPQAAVAIAADVAEALAAAHAAGVVHRDVKPENVLLDSSAPTGPGGAPPALLTDFGVAKLIDAPSRAPQAAAGARIPSQRRVIGTPDYLAPEIVEGLPARKAVDIYALATLLYELLAGFTPFGGGHTGAVLRRHVTETVAPLPGIPDELWQLLLQCLAKAPASRLRAAEMAAGLRALVPELEDLPRLDIDEPAADEPEPVPAGAVDAYASGAEQAPPTDGGRPLRGAVPLVRASAPDSNRDTHTSMRVPDSDELAGGARGTARVPKVPGQPRPGSARARQRTPVRTRRLRLGIVAVAIAAAAGIGGWVAASGDNGGAPPGGNSEQSSPEEP
ncbi:serine/threonine protein kinase [Streptomyces sp. A7024]|uniref:non-specific serine/threonine protein kinase n=1 Tax=Streptomyces coryli TaxID=1128680 RepID=A0A6G4TYU9_9ACTN|nr:serine/threonine-protein kinase [Streptomyces coryli]NGN65064.1 serine/threonine protein kinase [Streptomyces coryli]